MPPRNAPELTAVETLKRFASGWGGVISIIMAAVAAIVFLVLLNNKVDALKTDADGIKSKAKDAEASIEKVQTSVQDLSKTLNERIDQANARIDHLSDSQRMSTPLGRAIPTPEIARKISPKELKARFQQASYIVNSDLQKQVPQKPDVVKLIRNDLNTTLKNVPLPEDVHQAGVVALAHVQGYVVFCSRAFTQGIRGAVILPEGNMMLAGGGSETPNLRVGAVWNVGKGQDKTAFIIAPSYPPPSVFYADAPSVMTDLSILSLNWPRDLDALTLRGDNASALFFHVGIRGLNQNLAKITWLSVTFQNSVVRYNGEPLYLVDVRFENCKFEFGKAPPVRRC
jgi:archaellum component FlaC